MSLLTAVRETFTGFKSLLIGMRITAREATKPVITVQYPHATLKMPERFRGHIKLVLDPETGKARCTACGLCARACPSGCIVLDGVKREGDKRKSVSKYDLDFTKCSLCGSCVEICASDALDFSKDYNVVSMDRGDFSHIDLYQKIEAEARKWSESHPQPAVVPAVPAAVVTAPVAANTPVTTAASAAPVVTAGATAASAPVTPVAPTAPTAAPAVSAAAAAVPAAPKTP
jgi:NADH-quinone oxidoreductase subunit I